MLNTTQLQFLVLLRAGLWNKLVNIDELIHPEAYRQYIFKFDDSS